ncbi:MAG: pilus assembly protein PilM, partial [Verrucomicrobiota bacterium]
MNNEPAGAVVGLFGLTFNPVRSVLQAIVVTETIVTNAAEIPFSLLDGGASPDIKSVSEDARLLELLHKTIRNKGFSTLDTYLSFSLKEILVRWFLIPWMRPHEIQGVVTFEARKYIPFPLDEVSLDFCVIG